MIQEIMLQCSNCVTNIANPKTCKLLCWFKSRVRMVLNLCIHVDSGQFLYFSNKIMRLSYLVGEPSLTSQKVWRDLFFLFKQKPMQIILLSQFFCPFPNYMHSISVSHNLNTTSLNI